MKPRIRRIAFVAWIVLFGGLMCWEAYEFVVVNRGIDYYRSRPDRLWLIPVLAVPIGLAVSFGCWLQERRRVTRQQKSPGETRDCE